MSSTPRALVATFVGTSIVTIALAALLALPASALKPVRSWPVDLDEPAAGASGSASH